MTLRELLDKLQELGVADTTPVMISTEHGWFSVIGEARVDDDDGTPTVFILGADA